MQGIPITKVTARCTYPNSQHGRQDPLHPDERKSSNHSEKRPYREICRSCLQDTRREHPGESQRCLYRETCRGTVDSNLLLQDFNKTEEINPLKSRRT